MADGESNGPTLSYILRTRNGEYTLLVVFGKHEEILHAALLESMKQILGAVLRAAVCISSTRNLHGIIKISKQALA
jgi:hypothetical protein